MFISGLFALDGPGYLTTRNLPYCEACRFVLVLHYVKQIEGYCQASVQLKTVGINSTQLFPRLIMMMIIIIFINCNWVVTRWQ